MSQHKCVFCHKLFDIKNDDEHRSCLMDYLKDKDEHGGIYIQSYDDWIRESSKYFEKTKPKIKKVIRVQIKKSNL